MSWYEWLVTNQDVYLQMVTHLSTNWGGVYGHFRAKIFWSYINIWTLGQSVL